LLVRDRTRRIASIALAALLLVSTVAVGMPLASMSAAAAPSGMVALDGSSITEEVPSGESIPASASDFEGRIYSTEHAESMSLTLTTGGHADEVMGSDAVHLDGDGMVLVLADDENHGAREVAIEATVLSNSLGHVPKWAVATHEDGSTWKRPVTYEDGYVRFEVPHFSSNAVSFESEISISASAASNGTSFNYDVSDLDAASDPTVDLTGKTTTETDTDSAAGVADGGSVNIEVAGTTAPTNSTVTFSGVETSQTRNITATTVGDGTTQNITVNGNLEPTSESLTFTGKTSTSAGSDSSNSGGSHTVEVGGNTAPTNEEITVTGEQQSFSDDQISKPYQFKTSTYSGAPLTDATVSIKYANDVYYNHVYWRWYADGNRIKSGEDEYWNREQTKTFTFSDVKASSVEFYAYTTANAEISSMQVSVTVDGSNGDFTVNGTSYNVGALRPGESATKSVSLSSGSNSLNFASNRVNWDASWTERTATEDPSVDIDGDGTADASHSGILTEGETASVGSFNVSTGDYTAITSTASGSSVSWDFGYSERNTTDTPSIDVDGDGAADASYSGLILPSESQTVPIDGGLSLSTSRVDVSATRGPVDVSIEYTERTQTTDPGVVLNGNCTVSHAGTLTDGETVSLTADESCLEEGTNEFVVEVGDGSLSADAPDPKVSLNITHDALERKIVDYGEQQWTVRYATSKTFASERPNAWLNTTFEHSVVEIRDLDVRWNESGDFVGLGSSYYQLDGNDVAVDLDEAYGGTIPANTTVEVRMNGSRVDPVNMTLSVDEASGPNEDLASRVTIGMRSEGAHINVGPTASGSRIHFTKNESWSSPSTYVEITPGEQSLFVPGASAGDAFTVRHLLTAASVSSGDVRIAVEKSGESPEFAVSSGPDGDGDTVEFTHYATTDGVKYNLLSKTQGVVRDSATANSPVTLVDDDSDEMLAIDSESTSTSSDGGDDIIYDRLPGQFDQESSNDVSLGLLALIGVPLLGLAGAVVVHRRRGDSSSSTTPVRVVSAVGRAVSTSVRTLSGEPRVVVALGVLGGIALVLTGAVSLPPGTGLLLVIAGLPLVTFLVLRRLDSWSSIVFGTVSAIAVVLGLQLLGADPVGKLLDALGPGVLILALGLLFLAYQAVQAARAPEEVNNLNIGDGDA
jgi:hypothetical protein